MHNKVFSVFAEKRIALSEVQSSDIRARHVWSDLRTTHLLLPVGDAPDESVKVSIGCRAQIKVLNHGSQHPGVGLSQPLGCDFDLKLPDYVLTKKR